jgi:hypothetical protein
MSSLDCLLLTFTSLLIERTDEAIIRPMPTKEHEEGTVSFPESAAAQYSAVLFRWLCS